MNFGFRPKNPAVRFDDQTLHRFINVEKEFMPAEGYAQSKGATFRRKAVTVILESSRRLNFQAFEPYLALNLFDRFISNNPLPNLLDSVQDEVVLVANCCLMLPYFWSKDTLSIDDFLEKTQMKKHGKDALRVAIVIVEAIKGDEDYEITAVSFYKMLLLRIPGAHTIKCRVVNQIIIQAHGDITITEFRPSVIAAAAIMTACRLTLRKMESNCYKWIEDSRLFNEVDLEACFSKLYQMCKSKNIIKERDNSELDGEMNFKMEWITNPEETEIDVTTSATHHDPPVKDFMDPRIYDPLNPVDVSQEQNTFERYLNVENEFMAAKGYAKSKEATTLRKIAVRVIIENSRGDNNDAFIPYLALIFFDCFISHNPLPNLLKDLREEVVLIANCCLQIAYEMRDSTFRLRNFLERIGMIEHILVLIQMKLAILNGFDGKTCAVTAVCFVNMFVRMIPEARHIKQRTLNEIVIQAQGNVKFTKFRASVIAAAAILSACKLQYKGNDMYYNCYKFLLGLRFVHEEELNACTKKTTKICIYKRIAIEEDEPGSSSQAGGSSSSITGKEPQQGISGTKDAKVDPETQLRPDIGPLKETSEVDPETQKREKEPLHEVSGTNHAKVDAETQQKPGKEPLQETEIRHRLGWKQLPEIEESEDETEIRDKPGKESVPDMQKAEAETEFRHRPGKESIPEILPVRRIEDIEPMNFELKWILWEDDTGETTIDSSLSDLGPR